MSAFLPFLGVSLAAPRSLLGRRNLCRDSCLLWPLFSPVASLSICWWGHGPSISLGSGDRGWFKQRSVVTWSWASQTLPAPYPPLTLPFPRLRFGVLFTLLPSASSPGYRGELLTEMGQRFCCGAEPSPAGEGQMNGPPRGAAPALWGQIRISLLVFHIFRMWEHPGGRWSQLHTRDPRTPLNCIILLKTPHSSGLDVIFHGDMSHVSQPVQNFPEGLEGNEGGCLLCSFVPCSPHCPRQALDPAVLTSHVGTAWPADGTRQQECASPPSHRALGTTLLCPPQPPPILSFAGEARVSRAPCCFVVHLSFFLSPLGGSRACELLV